MSRYWYSYDPGMGASDVASSYSKILIGNFQPGKPTCLTGAQICAIYSSGDVFSPLPNDPLSINLLNYINAALASGGQVPQPSLAGYKKYVYLRSF